MKQFAHPNLLRVYDYHLDEEEEEMQIIMEYCPLGDLSHLQEQKKTLPPGEVL
jgi:serine/threonine protein kinase